MKKNNINAFDILYEDNHLIVINKKSSQIVQGDKTGDVSLDRSIKDFIKSRDQKPGNVFLSVIHRIDRPVSGVVIFAKTNKALLRMNSIFREGEAVKVYWAITANICPEEGEMVHYLKKNEKQNKSYAYSRSVPGSKKAILKYRVIGRSDKYLLLEILLLTGRHHQIRCQLATAGSPVKGDLKYGFSRSNPDGSISLHARRISFMHPVKNENIEIIAPVPDEKLWKVLEEKIVRGDNDLI